MKSLIQNEITRAKIRKKAFFGTAGTVPVPERLRVIVALAADYGNLGDVAITYAQERFLAATFPDRDIVVWPISRTTSDLKSMRASIRPSDLITTIGGGNTGDRYDDIEALRQLIIQSFPRNHIVSFPQSVEFSKSLGGRIALMRATRIYGRHTHLTLLARDPASADFYRRHFPQAQVALTPDVVLTLDETKPLDARSGFVLSLREDGEAALSAEQRTLLEESLGRRGSVTALDTHAGRGRIDLAQGRNMLQSLWDQYRSAELVVTDRLHGMIFATITGTPCIALDNNNAKVSRFHDNWLRDAIPTTTLMRRFSLSEFQDRLDGDVRTFDHTMFTKLRDRAIRSLAAACGEITNPGGR